jgi:hypothetical protein
MGAESGVREMMTETAQIPASGSDVRQAELVYSTAPPWRLEVTLDNGTVLHASENDLFECLVAVRRQLEREGILLCCEGARCDVFPSGMARQMAGGRKAYRHFANAGRRPELVDIFTPTDCSEVCTVDRQLESVRKLRRG